MTSHRAGLASIVHYAKEQALRHGVEVPPSLCRPTAIEQGLFKDVSGLSGSTTTVATGLPSGGRELKKGKFRAVDGLGIRDIKPPEMLIKDFLVACSYAMLIGAPGAFKTFIALAIGMHIATGGREGSPWGEVIRSGPVGMAVGEGRAGCSVRKQAWEDHYNGGEVVKDFVLLDPVPLVSGGKEEWAEFVELALSFHSEYALMVIDTAGRAMQGVNESSQEFASMLTQMVQFIQEKLNCVVLVLHHVGYGEKAQERARGSSVFAADVDTALVVMRDGKSMTVELKVTKQKDIPEADDPISITLTEVSNSLVAVPATKEQAAMIAKDGNRARDAHTATVFEWAIVDILRKNPAAYYSDSQIAFLLREHASIEGEPSDRTLKRHIAAAARRKGSPCAPMYDVRLPTHKGRWRYVGDDAPAPLKDGWARGEGSPFDPVQTKEPQVRRRRPG